MIWAVELLTDSYLEWGIVCWIFTVFLSDKVYKIYIIPWTFYTVYNHPLPSYHRITTEFNCRSKVCFVFINEGKRLKITSIVTMLVGYVFLSLNISWLFQWLEVSFFHDIFLWKSYMCNVSLTSFTPFLSLQTIYHFNVCFIKRI